MKLSTSIFALISLFIGLCGGYHFHRQFVNRGCPEDVALEDSYDLTTCLELREENRELKQVREAIEENRTITNSTTTGRLHIVQQRDDEMRAIQVMLDFVIICESSGMHENVWGAEMEYGTLQFKEETFYFLAEKYGFVGEWKNEDDQIALFLLVSDEDKEIHWTCYRSWIKTLPVNN